jgi:hypothetical protein
MLDKKSIAMNRKGHVPTILLFVIALILVLTAWFTFFNIKGEVDEEAREISQVIANLNSEERYVSAVFERLIDKAIEKSDEENFKESFEVSFVEIVGNVEEVSDVKSNFFEKVDRGEYEVVEENIEGVLVYNLTIEDVFVISQVEKNELKAGFDLSERFNEE